MPSYLVTFRNLNSKEDLYKSEVEAEDSNQAIGIVLTEQQERFKMIQPDNWVTCQQKGPEDGTQKSEPTGKLDGERSDIDSSGGSASLGSRASESSLEGEAGKA